MEKIRISDTLNFDTESIEIRYEGIPLKEDSNENEARRMVRDFVDNHNHENMLENVAILRTILRDYKETLLAVYFCNEKGKETVRYTNLDYRDPFIFMKESKDNPKYKIEYESTSGLKIDYANGNNNIEKQAEELNSIMQHISALANVGPVIINDNDKELIEIYKLFYGENPDFSSKDISVKIHSMMSILAEFGITLDCDYSFSLMTKLKMPFSLKLEEMIKKMYPLGIVNDMEDNVKLADESKKIIRIVGETVKESIHDEEDINEALINLSKVIHASRYNLSSGANTDEIASFTNSSVDDVEASVQLVKRIEHKINKES